ncbi:MAG: type II toxin-antitoxin system VapC family toxin [Coriobacteriia bacterium]|nr:type II toxin-antitoxin system VapC family toxin [Coriobacteriia bacterium]
MPEPAPAILVIDSSVAVKWFLPEGEADGERAWALLESHLAERIRLAAPDHLRLEVLNALRHRGFNAQTIRRAADALDGFHLVWHPVSASLAVAACDIAARHGLTLYDAAYAALAVALDAELVTADRRLAGSGAGRARLLAE